MRLKQNQLFFLSLAAIVFTIGGAMLIARLVQSNQQGQAAPQSASRQTAAPLSPEETAQVRQMQDRMGPDDGPVAAIFFGGTIQGNLDTCG